MENKLKLSHSQIVGYDPNEVRQRLIELLKKHKPKFKQKGDKRRLVNEGWLNHNIGWAK